MRTFIRPRSGERVAQMRTRSVASTSETYAASFHALSKKMRRMAVCLRCGVLVEHSLAVAHVFVDR